jgi:predicted CXXCH cytochrome family protein
MSLEPATTNRRTRRGPTRLVAGLALLTGLGLAGAWLARWTTTVKPETPSTAREESSDPRLTYSGPYRNVDPAVRYVGDAQCAGCHEEIARSYARHPMGQSLVPAADLAGRQRYTPDTHNPFTALGRRFSVERDGTHVRHRQAVLDDVGAVVVSLDMEPQWVIGSGRKGYSYLVEEDGYLLQTPISWFTQKERWDLSPGFGPPVLAGRVLTASCLSCHANRVREHPDTPDRFVEPIFEGHAIGCERCHGPGERHARGDQDHAIVNPARLSPPLRDAVCEQCHLEGEARLLRFGRGPFDFRPGLSLADFWAVLVPARQSGEDAKAVNHVEQMRQSRCAQRPVGGLTLGCITCHDPHVAVGPDERERHYRAACLKCHDEAQGQRGCSAPLPERRRASPADSCIACHMPRYTASDIAHTASTDHRILRRPAHDRPVPAMDLNNAHFVNFYGDHFPDGDPEAERLLGLGLVKLMNNGQLRPDRHGPRALLLLESALGRHPQDADVRESMVQALALLRRPAEVLTEARSALKLRPGNWRLLVGAAAAAQLEGQPEAAIDYWRRAAEINPFVPEYHVNLVTLLIRMGEIDEARERCRKLLRLDPFNVSGRQLWIGFRLRDGKKDEARGEFDIIRRLKPPDLAKREEWFREQLR